MGRREYKTYKATGKRIEKTSRSLTRIEETLQRRYPDPRTPPEQLMAAYEELRATHDASVAALWSNSFDAAGRFSISAEEQLVAFQKM